MKEAESYSFSASFFYAIPHFRAQQALCLMAQHLMVITSSPSA